MPVARRAAVLFVPQPVAGLVDDIRRRWDPVMLGRIDAHVTMIHDASSTSTTHSRSWGKRLLRLRRSRSPSTTARCWTRAANGVYLDIDDPTGGVTTLHERLAGPRVAGVSEG